MASSNSTAAQPSPAKRLRGASLEGSSTPTKKARVELAWESIRDSFAGGTLDLVEVIFGSHGMTSLLEASIAHHLCLIVSLTSSGARFHQGHDVGTLNGLESLVVSIFGVRLTHLVPLFPLHQAGGVYAIAADLLGLHALPRDPVALSNNMVIQVRRFDFLTQLSQSFLVERMPVRSTLEDIRTLFEGCAWVTEVLEVLPVRVGSASTGMALVRAAVDFEDLQETGSVVRGEVWNAVQELRTGTRNPPFLLTDNSASYVVRLRGLCLTCGLGSHGPRVDDCPVKKLLAIKANTPEVAVPKVVGGEVVEVKMEEVEVAVPTQAPILTQAAKPSKKKGKAKEVAKAANEVVDFSQSSRDELLAEVIRLSNPPPVAGPSKKRAKKGKAPGAVSKESSFEEPTE